jgi:hypothetical protein
MYSNNKQIRDVADVAARIMSGQQPVVEELKGGQVKLDKNHNGKIDGQDFKILKGQKKANEEVAEETQFNDHEKGAAQRLKDMAKNEKEAEKRDKRYQAMRNKKEQDKMNKEEVEQIDEVKMADLPSTKVQGRAYGASKPEPHAVDTIKGPNDAELKKIEAEKKKKKFSEMVNLYQEKGLKSISEMITKKETVEEGASEDEYNAQLDVAKFKANTKDVGAMPVKQKTTMVPKAGQLSVKTEETHTMVQVIDLDGINGVQHSEIDLADIQERSLTAAETNKKEEIVKSMKKGLAGFKDRYGDRAKEVMYATATKQAKKD